MFQKVSAFFTRYERHLSALAMIAGFIADNLIFDRVDLWQTQAVFAAYALTCFFSISLLQWVETRGFRARLLRAGLPLATQFALGGFWSGFVIFYGRSAVFGASWPFLLFLFLVFLGSEYFHQYHSRLVFTSVLFFFALYSYAIFAVPVYTGNIGTGTFLLSGAIAIAAFALFTVALRLLAHDRFYQDVWRIRIGAGLVVLAMNLSYFTNILPPLPLSAEAGGIYHLVTRVPGAYLGSSEEESFFVRYLGFTPTIHVTEGENLYAYSSVFAPTALATTIVHRWQWYNPLTQEWLTRARITYPIAGGRDGGYRGYSQARISNEGKWRVSIETADGRIIDRLPFTAVRVDTAVPQTTETLK